MGWQDREYGSQINYGGNPYSHPLLKLVFGSLYVGTLFRTRIRIHASLIWYIVLTVALAGAGWKDAAISVGMLFGIVFLHEFGHIFACRSVGGDADEMLLWILGGLAFARSPRRAWAHFVTVAGGPLVNVIIGLIVGSVIYFGFGVVPPMNPLWTFMPGHLFENLGLPANHSILELFRSPSGRIIFWLYQVNWSLLFFNLIPMFPLDGGQLLQAILWKPLGYIRATKIACYVGMFMAVLMGLFGLRFATWLLFISVFSFMGCLNQLRVLQHTAAQDDAEPYDLSAAWEDPSKAQTRRKKRKKRWFRSARKRATRDQAEQAKIDSILAKVKEKGLHSLTWWEKRTLKKATERQRQQDLAERL